MYGVGGRSRVYHPQDIKNVAGTSRDSIWSRWEVAGYCIDGVVGRRTLHGVGGRSRDTVWAGVWSRDIDLSRWEVAGYCMGRSVVA